MNVFVLCTGRSGSVSFIRACSHIANFSSSHESRSRRIGIEFPHFWKMIGAEGDLPGALETFRNRHNVTKTRRLRHLRHEMRFRLMKLRRRIF